MPLIAKESKESHIEPIPTGLHHSVCYAAIDIGTQPQVGNYPSRRKVMLCWEIPGERIEIEKDGKKQSLPRCISKGYTLSLASKGNLRPMLESWRGRPFTEAELEGFDIAQIVGANCFLNIIHEKGKGDKANRTYANVASVNPLPKGSTKLKAETPAIVFSMDDFPGPVTIPQGVPEWIEGLIKQSDEYILKAQASNTPPPAQPSEGEKIDEDVPF